MANKMQIGVQLYTLRDLTSKDFAATVREAGKIGYRYAELAGYGNLKSPADVRKALDDAGVKLCGAHVGIDQMQRDLGKVMDDHDVLGNKALVVPWIGEDWRSEEGYKRLGAELGKAAKAAAARGFTVAYHNHSFEFQKYNGRAGLDIVYGDTDPDLVRAELDLFWVRHGDVDPVQYINKLDRRVALVHLKDMSRADKNKFAPVGTGVLDFKSIVDACNKVGVRFGVVEQDDCYSTPPLDAIRTSYENLKQIGAL